LIEGVSPHIPSVTPETMSLPDEYEGQYKEERRHRMRRALPGVAGALIGLGLLAAVYQPYRPTPLPVDNSPNPHVLEQQENIGLENRAIINFVVQNFPLVDTASAQEPEDDVNTQIVGGRPAEVGELPFMVVLFHTGTSIVDNHYCGGTALNNIHILTAGHCTSQETASQISIFTGIDLRNPGSGETIQVARVYRLPCFNDEWDTCDFAILELTRPLTTITDFAIVAPRIAKPGESLTVPGWGRLYEGGPKSDILMLVTEPAWSQDECRALHPNWFTVDMTCAGNRVPGMGACNGDSGGPAIMGEKYVYGVHSWGVGCGEKDEANYFSSVQINYLNWLLSITGVPASRIIGDLDEDTGEFSFTVGSPYPGRTPDTPATWNMVSSGGWNRSRGSGSTWNDAVALSLLENTQVITVTAKQPSGVRASHTVIIHPAGVNYLPIVLK
jgi:trypsin